MSATSTGSSSAPLSVSRYAIRVRWPGCWYGSRSSSPSSTSSLSLAAATGSLIPTRSAKSSNLVVP